jgi:uncharacterized repeat protein (TIGR03843 family)
MSSNTAGDRLQEERALHLLSEGEMEVEGLIPWSSNATLLVTLRDGDDSALAIYKPQRGERPLWDFPPGSLGRREVAAYLAAAALGWNLIPPTILRGGPYGRGSVQLFVEAQPEANFFTVQEDARYADDLKRLAALDGVANNADRKAGHCLVDREGQLWAIDNALTFHAEPKLRTVIWDYAGMPLPGVIVADLQGLLADLGADRPLSRALGRLLSVEELAVFRRRVGELIRVRRYPQPGPGRSVPWPLI